MEDGMEQDKEITIESSEFSSVAPQAPPSTRENEVSRGAPVTPTKSTENANLLKRSINDLSFIPEPITRKSPRTSNEEGAGLFMQIMAKLQSLSKTVESQTAHIVALETRIEELCVHSKGSNQADKANRAATKKIETMADRVAAMASTATSLPGSANVTSPAQRGQSQVGASNLNKSSPPIVLDLSQCTSSLNERPVKEIRMHLQASLKASDRTKAIDIRAMSRDNCKDHRYVVFVTTQVQEDALRVHIDEWLLKAFSKVMKGMVE